MRLLLRRAEEGGGAGGRAAGDSDATPLPLQHLPQQSLPGGGHAQRK